MSKLDDLAERVDRLVLRHVELKRTSSILEQQLAAVTADRDSLRSRLAAARARVDALLARLPQTAPAASIDAARHTSNDAAQHTPGDVAQRMAGSAQ